MDNFIGLVLEVARGQGQLDQGSSKCGGAVVAREEFIFFFAFIGENIYFSTLAILFWLGLNDVRNGSIGLCVVYKLRSSSNTKILYHEIYFMSYLVHWSWTVTIQDMRKSK